MAAASRYNMKTTWRKDTVSFLATDHAGNTPGAQIKRYHPLSFCYRWAIIAVGGILFGYALVGLLVLSTIGAARWGYQLGKQLAV